MLSVSMICQLEIALQLTLSENEREKKLFNTELKLLEEIP